MPNLIKRETVENIIIAIAFIIAVIVAVMWLPKKGDVIVYDCSMAEFHPDYPPQVKEECRKLRSKHLTTT